MTSLLMFPKPIWSEQGEKITHLVCEGLPITESFSSQDVKEKDGC